MSFQKDKLIVCIISASKHVEAREIIRQTWIKKLKEHGMDYFFVVSSPEVKAAIIKDDILTLPLEERYENLPKKIAGICEYVHNNTKYEHLYKIDDDCYLNLDNLSKSRFWEHDYFGRPVGFIPEHLSPTWHFGNCTDPELNVTPFIREYEGPWCGGGYGYFLSRKAMKTIIENTELFLSKEFSGPGYEDVAVAYLLKKYDILPQGNGEYFCFNPMEFGLYRDSDEKRFRDFIELTIGKKLFDYTVIMELKKVETFQYLHALFESPNIKPIPLNMPLVSIITRTKNRNLLLKRAIKSVFDQSILDFEMMIVNDGGDKKTLEDEIDNLVKIDRRKIKIIHNEKSIGMEAASNVGIKNSDAKYILILDDDDTLHPDFLKEMLPCLENNGNRKGVICWSTLIHEDISEDVVKTVSEQPFNHWLDGVTIASLLYNNMFPTNSFLYKREVLKNIGLYNESLPVLGDWDFNVRFILQYDIHIVKKELAYYHRRINLQSGSLSNSVADGNDSHKEYQIVLRNKWLRDDLSKGKMGHGVLSALLNDKIHLSEEALLAQNNPTENASRQNGKKEDKISRLNVQFFWAKDETSFSEGRSSARLVELHASPTEVSFALPEDSSSINFLRFDIGNKKCLVNIHTIEIKKENDILWKWDMNSISKKNDLLFIINNNYWPDKVVQISTSQDPFFITKIENVINGIKDKCVVTITLSALSQEQLNTINLMNLQEHDVNVGFTVR